MTRTVLPQTPIYEEIWYRARILDFDLNVRGDGGNGILGNAACVSIAQVINLIFVRAIRVTCACVPPCCWWLCERSAADPPAVPATMSALCSLCPVNARGFPVCCALCSLTKSNQFACSAIFGPNLKLQVNANSAYGRPTSPHTSSSARGTSSIAYRNE